MHKCYDHNCVCSSSCLFVLYFLCDYVYLKYIAIVRSMIGALCVQLAHGHDMFLMPSMWFNSKSLDSLLVMGLSYHLFSILMSFMSFIVRMFNVCYLF